MAASSASLHNAIGLRPRAVGWQIARALSLLLLAKIGLEVAVLAAGFISVSGDDFARTLIAHEWAKEPFIASGRFGPASVSWLPLPFWIVGSVLRVYPDLWLAPILTNLVLSLGTLVLAYLLGRRLFGDPVGLWAAILIGVTPWHVWLSVSGMAEIALLFFVTGGLYSLVRWTDNPQPGAAVLGVLAILAATAVRPEGWFYASWWSAYVGYRALGDLRRRRYARGVGLTLTAVVPWTFVAYWLVFNYQLGGHFLHFLALNRSFYEVETAGIDSVWLRLLQFPMLMAVVSPLTAALVLPASVHLLKRGPHRPAVRLYLAWCLGGVGSLVLAGLLGFGTTSAPQRYTLASLALLSPLIAHFLVSLAGRMTRPRVLWGGMVLYLLLSAAAAFRISTEFGDEARLGRALRNLWAGGHLSPDTVLCTDVSLVRLGALPVRGAMGGRYLVVDLGALKVLSNLADNFLEPWPARGDAAEQRHTTSECLASSRDVLLMLKSKDLLTVLPSRYRLGLRVGSYYVLTTAPERFEKLAIPEEGSVRHRIDANFGNVLTLVGYSLHPELLPQGMTMAFDFTGVQPEYYTLDLTVSDANTGRIVFHTAYPFLRPEWAVPPYATEQRRFYETLPFWRAFDFPAGTFFVYVSIRDLTGEPLPRLDADSRSPVARIGPIRLTPGKREAIKQVLRRNAVDPVLLLLALLSL